jgi:polyphosphate kinase
LRFFSEAIFDSSVIKIQITLYRISKDSLIAQSLIAAAKNGKDVVVFVEVKARYDELNNMLWAKEMEKAGVKIYYSIPKLKVHAKIALITRLEKDNKKVHYAYLATGNFNERTARIYADYGLFTIDKKIARELNLLFDYLITRKSKAVAYKTLLVSRFNMKKKLLQLIDKEIAASKNGLPAKIHLKMNSMDEVEMIEKLYEASQQGVEVKLIVRAGCSLIPGIPGISENISAYRIVDHYLEHARIYYFYQEGKEPVYLSSADWMNRNLNKRIEVAFPVLDKKCKAQIRYALDLQLADNRKRTPIHQSQKITESTRPIRAQTDTYSWLNNLEELNIPTPSTQP